MKPLIKWIAHYGAFWKEYGRGEDRIMNIVKKAATRKPDPVARTNEPGDWREHLLSRIRTLIEQADPEMIEERKWRKASNAMAGVPVWSHNWIVCTGETYNNAVKMTFARGASLEDPSGLFNAGFEGNARRAIDFHEGDRLDEMALKALIQSAVALNTSSARR